MRRLAAMILGLSVLAGCGGHRAAVTHGARGDCLRAWNLPGNEANRRSLAHEADSWRALVRVGRSPAGCAYVYDTGSRRIDVYTGDWQANGDLRWSKGSPERRLHRPEQVVPQELAGVGAGGMLNRVRPV